MCDCQNCESFPIGCGSSVCLNGKENMSLDQAIKFCEDKQLNISFTCSMNQKPFVKISANGWYEEIADTLIEAVKKFKYGFEKRNEVEKKTS